MTAPLNPYLFPEFRIVLAANGVEITKANYPTAEVGYTAAYGQGAEFTFVVVGSDALALDNTGLMAEGAKIAVLEAGYAEGPLKVIGKNLLIYEVDYDADESDRMTCKAYGVGQKLRQSGERTTKLAAKTYADAVKEVCKRHGITVRIGPAAYVNVPEEKDATSSSGAGAATPPLGPSSAASATTGTLVPEEDPSVPVATAGLPMYGPPKPAPKPVTPAPAAPMAPPFPLTTPENP